MPLLAPIIETLKQLGRYTDAELMAAVVSGMYTVFIETQAPEQKPIWLLSDLEVLATFYLALQWRSREVLS